jgi:hypothetical protein
MGGGSSRDPQRVKCAPFWGWSSEITEAAATLPLRAIRIMSIRSNFNGWLLFASKRSIGFSSA